MNWKNFLTKVCASFGVAFLVFLSVTGVVWGQATVGPSNPRPSTQPTSANTGITYECVDSNGVYGNCSFDDLIRAVKRVVNAGTVFALAFSVVVIAYAGFIYMKSGDSAGERSKANAMFVKVGIGIAAILGAWLIVKLITDQLLTSEVKQYLPF